MHHSSDEISSSDTSSDTSSEEIELTNVYVAPFSSDFDLGNEFKKIGKVDSIKNEGSYGFVRIGLT
jgi:hypothetical protein